MTQSLSAPALPGDASPPDALADAEPRPPDRALLERYARGDRDAFAVFVRTHSSAVYSYLARAGVAPSDRDDVFQEIFCKVHRALAREIPDRPIGPWLFAITVNTVRDSFRRAKVRAFVRPGADPERALDATRSGADDALDRARTVSFVEAEMAKLPLPQREALALCAMHGMSLEDAATALDAPVETVRTRLRRARLTLSEAMQRREGSR